MIKYNYDDGNFSFSDCEVSLVLVDSSYTSDVPFQPYDDYFSLCYGYRLSLFCPVNPVAFNLDLFKTLSFQYKNDFVNPLLPQDYFLICSICDCPLSGSAYYAFQLMAQRTDTTHFVFRIGYRTNYGGTIYFLNSQEFALNLLLEFRPIIISVGLDGKFVVQYDGEFVVFSQTVPSYGYIYDVYSGNRISPLGNCLLFFFGIEAAVALSGSEPRQYYKDFFFGSPLSSSSYLQSEEQANLQTVSDFVKSICKQNPDGSYDFTKFIPVETNGTTLYVSDEMKYFLLAMMNFAVN